MMPLKRPLVFDIDGKCVRETRAGDCLFLEGNDDEELVICIRRQGEAAYVFTIDNRGNLQLNGINLPAGKTYDVGGIPHSHAGSVATCKQTVQVTNSSNTLPADIPGLCFDLVSGRRYIFKFHVTFKTAATGTGVGFTFSAPQMTAANWKAGIVQGAAGTDHIFENSATDLSAVLVSTGIRTANTDYMATIEGFCELSEDGCLQLRCRSEINGSQITIKNSGVGCLIDAG